MWEEEKKRNKINENKYLTYASSAATSGCDWQLGSWFERCQGVREIPQ
jgi:hypothetical protein